MTKWPTDRHWLLGGALIAVLLLLATLGLPLGMDQGMFLHVADALIHGARPYTDVVELKPPIIHYWYALGRIVGGDSVPLLRLVDVLLQGSALLLLAHLMRRYGATGAETAAALVTMALLNAALASSGSFQTETTAAVWLLLLLVAHDRHPGTLRTVLLALGLGMLLATKQTLAVVAVPLFAADLRRRGRAAVPPMVTATGGALALCLLCFLPTLLAPGGSEALLHLLDYQRAFAVVMPPYRAAVQQGIDLFGIVLLEHVTPCTVALMAAGTVVLQRRRPDTTSLLLGIAAIQVVAIVVEHRFAPYHVARMFPVVAVLAGFGLPWSLRLSRRAWREANVGWRLPLTVGGLLFAVYSPLPRAGMHTALAVGQLAGHDSYVRYLDATGVDGLNVSDHRAVATALNARAGRHDVVDVLSVRTGLVSPSLYHRRDVRFTSAHMVTGRGAPEAWRDWARADLARATLVAVDTADVVPALTLHGLSTWQWLRRDSAMWNVVTRRYVAVDTVHTFIILAARERRP